MNEHPALGWKGHRWPAHIGPPRSAGSSPASSGRARPPPPARPRTDRPLRHGAKPAAELKLASKPQTLDRMVAVRPNSIAVVFDPQHRPRIWFPGEMVKPGLFPGLHPLQVVALTTGPVSLDVTVGPLTTVDGQVLEHAKIRLVVQLNDNNRYATVGELAADAGPDLEGYLLQRVQNEVASEVYAAVRMNRLADLRRQTLESVLADRWLPRAFAGGALLRRSFSVLDAPWPDAPKAPASAASGPARKSDEPPETVDSPPAGPDHGRPAAAALGRPCRRRAARNRRGEGEQQQHRGRRAHPRARRVRGQPAARGLRPVLRRPRRPGGGCGGRLLRRPGPSLVQTGRRQSRAVGLGAVRREGGPAAHRRGLRSPVVGRNAPMECRSGPSPIARRCASSCRISGSSSSPHRRPAEIRWTSRREPDRVRQPESRAPGAGPGHHTHLRRHRGPGAPRRMDPVDHLARRALAVLHPVLGARDRHLPRPGLVADPAVPAGLPRADQPG